MDSASNSTQARPKPQTRACEACRSAKIRCQVGLQPGTCKRCSEFKRECVFRTGPRTRRPKVPKGNAELSPLPGPSQTFSIDFTMPAAQEPTSSFDELRDQHERYIDSLVPSSSEEEEDFAAMSSSSVGPTFSFSSLSTPSSSSAGTTASRPMHDVGIKPQFNLDSAAKLLQTFRGMLTYCPCVVLDDDVEVRSMARESPFVLLAILAATSCSTSLQGHSLYDEEFRKVLGLKSVTSGERSLELLQGILVYCAWYPFHLRPKHRQAIQYQRMAAEIVRDLQLDREATFASQIESGLSKEDLTSFRAYLTCYYLDSNVGNTWFKAAQVPYTSWIAKCCDLLEQHSSLEQDHILVWLIRFHHICDEIVDLQKSYKKPHAQSEHHRGLIRMGLESQLREWQSLVPTNIAMHPSIMITSLFSDMYLVAAPLMGAYLPRSSQQETPIDPLKLMGTLQTLTTLLELLCTLSESELTHFSSLEWGHVILAVIIGFRLSFPLEVCPSWDAAQARRVFNFSSYLERLSREPDGNENETTTTTTIPSNNSSRNKTTCATAFRVVLRSVKVKFDKKVAAADAKEALIRRARECPMFDGSIDDYITLWDGQGETLDMTYATSQSATSGVMTDPIADMVSDLSQAKPVVYHDLWATMTQGWGAEEGMPDLDMTGAGLDYGHM